MITIPTINEISDSILNSLETEYGIEIPASGKNFLRSLALVQAAKIKMLYLAIADVQKNVFPDMADPESNGGTLERFGRIKLGRSPFQAIAGVYSVSVTGTTGAVIPPQTIFKSNDDSSNPGFLFICDSGYTLTGTSGSFHVRALTSGTDSQLNNGDELTATIPLANIDQIVEVIALITTPIAAETIEDYRTKVLQAYRLEPQGGSVSDYTLWSFDAQGVANIYPYLKTGSDVEIDVFVEATIIDSIDGKGTPSSAILDAVDDVLEFDPDTTKSLFERGRRPIGIKQNNILPVTIREIDITINSFSGLTAAIENEIETGIETMLSTIRPFVAGRDILENKNDILDTNKIIAEILKIKPGSSFGSIVLNVDSVVYSSFVFENGDIPHLNSITFA